MSATGYEETELNYSVAEDEIGDEEEEEVDEEDVEDETVHDYVGDKSSRAPEVHQNQILQGAERKPEIMFTDMGAPRSKEQAENVPLVGFKDTKCAIVTREPVAIAPKKEASPPNASAKPGII